MERYVGIDVGGTNTKLGIFNKEGNLIQKWLIRTDIEDGGRFIWKNISQEIRKHIRQDELAGIGIGVPGPVRKNGFVKVCTNLGIRNVNIKDRMKEEFPEIPIAIGNDANVAALGEAWQGSGQGFQNIVMITLGTGVGSGIVLDGNILYGSNGLGGEIGHATVNSEEREQCPCGGMGCLDQIASATGLVRYTKLFLSEDSAPSILRQKEAFSAKAIFQAAKCGDTVAEKSIDYCMDYLGKSMVFVGYVVDPEVFIIGGGVSNAGQYLLNVIRRSYEYYCRLTDDKAEIRLAALGNDAGIFGAAKMVMED